MLRSPGTGRTTSATSPMATVSPESTTARPAVSTAVTTARGVVRPVRPLLAPAGDEQQRVVDGDPEADEGDEELDDERDVGDVREPEHDEEGGEDRDGGDEQRHEGQERGEDEREDDQRAGAADHRLDEHARDPSTTLPKRAGSRPVRPTE